MSSNFYTASIIIDSPLKKLSEKDFLIESREALSIQYDDCNMILFYDESDLSRQILPIWEQTANSTVGPIFSAINLVAENKVANRFIQIKLDLDHPLNWASMGQTPFVLVYRKGWPQAFYNGNYSVEEIKNYALNYACKSGFKDTTFGSSVNITDSVSKPSSTNQESNISVSKGGIGTKRSTR
jgi:hypothetical protein